MKLIFYVSMITVLVFSACSSGRSAFEQGNYYEAVITSVNRLRKNDDHKKSVETLRQAYPMAVRFYEDEANTAMASAASFKWSQVVNAYTTINNMYDEIKRCPGAMRVVPNPVNYFSKLQQARENAAEEHYAAGIHALQFNDREKAKQAYAFFKTANGFVSGYKEVISYMEAALSAATVKILVEPIPVHAKGVGVSAEFFNDKISEFVHAAPLSEFVKFYTRAEAKTIKLNPDHIIQLAFDDFTVGQVYKHEKEIQLTRDSVVMGTYVTPAITSQPNTDGGRTASAGKSSLVTAGSGVVVSAQTPVTTKTNTPSPVTGSDAEAKEKAAQAEQALVANRLAEQAESQRALAEKLKNERESADKQRAEQVAAEKAQAAQILEERARADKALSEKIKAEKEQAELERLEKERLAREAAEQARIEHEQAERTKIEREKAAAEAAEIALAKEKAEKQKAEKEKASKIKYVDATIHSSDTLDVKDPVTICHVPPGNNMQHRTLVISRSALKAHLGHGDTEGDCADDKKNIKTTPAKDKELKDKPHGNPKAKEKGPGASNDAGTIRQDRHANSFLYAGEPVLLATSSEDPGQFMRYLQFQFLPADTNKVYGTVKATLYHHKKTTTAKGVVSFRIVDAKTGALLAVEKMPGEYVWVSEWANFNGDERALSAEQLQLTRLKEKPAPAPQELFVEFTRPIYDQITTRIREFYKGY